MLAYHILNLFFPKLCGACSKIISNPTDELCLKCELHLIYESQPNKYKINQQLRGRVEINQSAFLIDFTKKEGIQQVLHSIKYQNQKQLAIYLAEELVKKLGHTFFADIDLLIPVPLHPKKRKIRGFNQSELIAQGIQNITSIKLKPIAYNENYSPKVKQKRTEWRDGKMYVMHLNLSIKQHLKINTYFL